MAGGGDTGGGVAGGLVGGVEYDEYCVIDDPGVLVAAVVGHL